MPITQQTPHNLSQLEEQLRNLSHNNEAIELIRKFSSSLGKTKHRQLVFNNPGALVQAPIFYDSIHEKCSLDAKYDGFSLLQGDIIQTDCAYFLGDRIQGVKFIVASSTCDLMKGRRNYSSLLRLQPLSRSDQSIKQLLGELLTFRSTWRMYLPPLDDDPPEVIGNAVIFDGIAQGTGSLKGDTELKALLYKVFTGLASKTRKYRLCKGLRCFITR